MSRLRKLPCLVLCLGHAGEIYFAWLRNGCVFSPFGTGARSCEGGGLFSPGPDEKQTIGEVSGRKK